MSLFESLREGLEDRYALEQEIGQGGMSRVFFAMDRKHDRPVAVKVLSPDLARALGRERFLREIHIAARLHHPHILTLYDSGRILTREEDGSPAELLYYVMPYVQGESLRDRLERENQLPLDDALAITRDVAEALTYAHSLGIVHRDIKPENIMLTGGHAIVADFGVACAVLEAADELTSAGIAVGTAAYMSPEQGAGRELLDGRADLYSLGCVLYEMLGGSPPFTGATAQAIIARHQFDPPPPIRTLRPSVPPAVEALIGRLLEKVPADRLATASQVLERLDARRPAATPTRRTPASLMAIAGALALLLGTAALWWAGRRTAEAPAPAHADPRHVAVLYFQNQSDDSALGPVAAGITEDLIGALSAVPALKVTSAEGVRRLRGLTLPLDSIGRMFDAGTIVTATLASAGGQLRVSYEMADPVSGVQLASGRIERPMSRLFELQGDLATAIALALRRELGREVVLRESRSRARNVEAWERVQSAALLRTDAADLIQQDDFNGASRLLARADSLLLSAQALDAQWVDPLLARAKVAYNQALVARMAGMPDAAGASRYVRTGQDLVAQVLARDPGNASALALRGLLRYTRWSAGTVAAPDSIALAQRDLEAAVDADPTQAVAWYTLSSLYLYTGRFSEAEAAASRALDADAWLQAAPKIVSQLFFSALNSGNYAEARRWCDQGRRRFHDEINFSDCGLRALGWLGQGPGDIRTAGRELDSLESLPESQSPSMFTAERRLLYAALLARSGERDSARRVLQAARAVADERLAQSDRDYLRYPSAWVYSLLGESDSTYALLRSFLADNPAARTYVAESPWFRPLRPEPRFRELMGLTTDAPAPSSP